MTVKGLVEQLQTLDQDTEIFILARKGLRPIFELKSIGKIETVFSIDNPPKETVYSIDVDVEPLHRIE